MFVVHGISDSCVTSNERNMCIVCVKEMVVICNKKERTQVLRS